LRKDHPELVGIGLGARRRKGGIEGQTTVKLQVHKKHRRMPKGRARLPKTVRLQASVLGQTVTLDVPTDVEEVQTAAATLPEVDGMIASALASWADARGTHVGLVTAGHGLPGVGEDVAVSLNGRTVESVVVLRSDLAADEIDVGLVEVRGGLSADYDVAPEELVLAPGPILSAERLLELIGSSTQDDISVRARTWSSPRRWPILALAFYAVHVLNRADGSTLTQRNVVECDAKRPRFKPGTSGSAWVTDLGAPSGEFVLALQSHGVKREGVAPFRSAYGADFGSARDWLARHVGRDLRLAWRTVDLTAPDGG
jgi:hypothetical protein